MLVISQINTAAGGLNLVSKLMYGMVALFVVPFWFVDRPDITLDVKLGITATGLAFGGAFYLLMRFATHSFSVTIAPTYFELTKGKKVVRRFGRDDVRSIAAYRATVTSVTNAPTFKMEKISLEESENAGFNMNSAFVRVSTEFAQEGDLPAFTQDRNLSDTASIFFQPTSEAIVLMRRYFADKIVA